MRTDCDQSKNKNIMNKQNKRNEALHQHNHRLLKLLFYLHFNKTSSYSGILTEPVHIQRSIAVPDIWLTGKP